MPDYNHSIPLDTNIAAYSERVDDAVVYIAREIKDKCEFKRWHERHDAHLKLLILNLYNNFCIDPELYTAYSRNRNCYNLIGRYNSINIKYDSTIKIIDALKSIEYVCGVKGFSFKEQKRSRNARFAATIRLIDLLNDRFEFNQINISRANDEEVILLKSSDKELVDYSDTDKTLEMRANLKFINSVIKRHFIGLRLSDNTLAKLNKSLQQKSEKSRVRNVIDYNKIKLKRIFNNSSFEEGGRFYNGWWQGVPSRYRPYITIDDRPTIEIDYSGYHINLLYAIEGLQLPNDDVYTVKGWPIEARGAYKAALQILLNSKNEAHATYAIQHQFSKPEYHKHLKGLLVKDLVESMKKKHHDISKHFFSGHGIKLQYIDSQIAENILLHLAYQDIVALPLHDSFIVQKRFKNELINIMREAIANRYGQAIEPKPDPTAFDLDLMILKEEVAPEDLPQSEEEYEEAWIAECKSYQKRYEAWCKLRHHTE